MIPVNLGPNLVFKDNFAFNKDIIIPRLEQNVLLNDRFDNYDGDLEIGNAGSTAGDHINQPHLQPEFKDFLNWALIRAHAILLKNWHFEFDYIKVGRSWANRHRRGGWTNWHNHANCDLVLAAYVQAPPNSGNLRIIDPMENHWFGMKTKMNLRSPMYVEYPVEDNAVYFFAPFLKHATGMNETDTDRWVISMNFNVMVGRP